MVASYRVLLCGTPGQCEGVGDGPGVSRLSFTCCHDAGGVAPMLAAARRDETPFEVVIACAASLGREVGQIAGILEADPNIGVILLDENARNRRDNDQVDRLTRLASPIDPTCVHEVAAALARSYRVRCDWETARSELSAMDRAYRAVSSEFQRQNKRLKEHEEKLEEQNKLFDAALNNMSQGLCMFDSAARLVVCNERYVEMYGLSRDFVQAGVTLRDLLEGRKRSGHFFADPERYCAELLAKVAQGKTTSQIVEAGDRRTIALINQPMAGGGWVATHEDITERTRAEAQIKHMARHDALTNLPNRVAFQEEMAQAFTRVRRGDNHAVHCLDLDHFKRVNDTLGHAAGDELLRAVTRRLHGCVRELDTVARLGGDEFAVLQAGVERPENAGSLAQRLIDAISEPYDIDGHQVVIGVSIGIALAPNDGADPEQLLRSADMALYRAKTDGRSTYCFFEAEMDAQLQERRTLELDLRKALVEGEFEVFYQPLVNAQTEAITCCEALLRWRHPQRGTVSPVEFIPLAEEIGLIVPLGEWVLRQACCEAATWPDQIKVAVNLSPVQFKSRNLVQVIVNALAQSGLPANRLELEITESVLLHDNEATLSTLHQLRNLGIRISMDDFGTGYSSLSYLRSFPFDKIKIDRSFVRDLSEQGDCAAIIKAVAGLGRGLGIITTAEGVETEAQLEHVRAEGCTEVQGYLFSAPRTAAEVRSFIDERRASRNAA
jgi:diguanylate cyclase (GGDEF)-like protein/PAS domain S-box-containing protein